MIKHSKAMLKGIGRQYEQNTDAKKFVFIFDGSAPNASVFQNLYNTNGVVTLADIMSLGTLRVALYYPENQRIAASPDVRWNLTGAEVGRQVLSEGTVSFFVFCYAATNAAWPALDNAAVIHKAYIGLAGSNPATHDLVVPDHIDETLRYSVTPFIVKTS